MFELIIEGITVPLQPGASLSLEINSGVFDLDVVKGVKSLPFTLPVCRETDLIFGGINKLQSGGSRRKTYSAELIAHGSLFIKGKFKLSKPTHNSYPGYLVASAGSLQQQVGTKKLQELDLGTTVYPKEYAISRLFWVSLPEIAPASWTSATVFSLFFSKGGSSGIYGSYYANFDGSISSTLSYLAAQVNADVTNTGGDIAHATGTSISIIASGTLPVNVQACSLLVGSGPSAIDYPFYAVLEKYTQVKNNDSIVYPTIYNPQHYPDGKEWNGIVNEIATPGSAQDTALTAVYGPGPHYLQNISGGNAEQGLTKYSLVPMLFLKNVLTKIFELADMQASGLLLDDEQLGKLLVYSNNAIDQRPLYEIFSFRLIYTGIDFAQVNDTIVHARQLPDLTVGEYLNQIRIPFNLGYFFDIRSNRVDIIPLSDIINAECLLDWTDRVVPAWEQDLTDPVNYTLSFAEDSADAVYKESLAHLASFTATDTTITEDSEVSSQTIESQVAPLPDTIVAARLLPYAKSRATTAMFGGINTEIKPRLLFWHGMSPDTNGNNYPKASNVSPDGSISLQWSGANGLYEKYWKDWIGFLQRSRPIEIPITLRPEDLAGLDLKKKVHIRGNDYLIEKLEISLPLKKENPGKLTARRC